MDGLVSSLFFVRLWVPPRLPKGEVVQPCKPCLVVTVQQPVRPPFKTEVTGFVKHAFVVGLPPFNLQLSHALSACFRAIKTGFTDLPEFSKPRACVASNRGVPIPILRVGTTEGPPPHAACTDCSSLRLARRSTDVAPLRRHTMGRVVVHLHGRPKERSMAAAIEMYAARLAGRGVRLQVHPERTSIEAYLDTPPAGSLRILLDEGGASLRTEAFVDRFKGWSLASEDVHLMVGPPDGWEKVAPDEQTLSLSPLTMTHELASVVLLEQLYRATEVLRGSSYHRA